MPLPMMTPVRSGSYAEPFVESRIGHRLHRRGDRVLREQVGALGLLALHVDERVEALHLAREPDRKRATHRTS